MNNENNLNYEENNWSNKPYVLKKVENCGTDLRHASKELKVDKDVVFLALTQNPWALQHASDKLKGDKDVVLLALIKDSIAALFYASNELKGDKGLVLLAVEQNGMALQYASDKLKGDKDVVVTAVKQNVKSLKYASYTLQCYDVVLAAVKENADALKYVSNELKSDKEFILKAMKENNWALQYASNELKYELHELMNSLPKKIEAKMNKATSEEIYDLALLVAIQSTLNKRFPDYLNQEEYSSLKNYTEAILSLFEINIQGGENPKKVSYNFQNKKIDNIKDIEEVKIFKDIEEVETDETITNIVSNNYIHKMIFQYIENKNLHVFSFANKAIHNLFERILIPKIPSTKFLADKLLKICAIKDNKYEIVIDDKEIILKSLNKSEDLYKWDKEKKYHVKICGNDNLDNQNNDVEITGEIGNNNIIENLIE
jgi:hypothetical protein